MSPRNAENYPAKISAETCMAAISANFAKTINPSYTDFCWQQLTFLADSLEEDGPHQRHSRHERYNDVRGAVADGESAHGDVDIPGELCGGFLFDGGDRRHQHGRH